MIEQISSIEDQKYSLDNSGIRARRGVTAENLTAEIPTRRPITPTPSIEVNAAEDNEGEVEIGRGTIVPRISLEESQENQDNSIIMDEPENQNVEIKEHETVEDEGHGQTVRTILN